MDAEKAGWKMRQILGLDSRVRSLALPQMPRSIRERRVYRSRTSRRLSPVWPTT